MVGIVGLIMIFVVIFGGFVLGGGNLDIILEAMPTEGSMIVGAGIATIIIGNDVSAIKHTAKDIAKLFKGSHWKKSDYRDLLTLLFELIRLAAQNPMALEEHIETPQNSTIFSKFPRILGDAEATNLISDTLRAGLMNYNDPNQVEEVLDKRVEHDLQHALHGSHALQALADGLPAIGIVVAVLGIVKTMGSIDQPPEILGKLIGSALVGTFLGVLLAYGLVAPTAVRVQGAVQEDHSFYQLIREVLIANLHHHPATICIEVGRQNIPRQLRPSFTEVESALKEVKQGAET